MSGKVRRLVRLSTSSKACVTSEVHPSADGAAYGAHDATGKVS